jgi:uncharacterized membrane protein (UPF0136 family)
MAVAVAVIELIDAFFIDVPAAAVVFGLLFLSTGYLIHRGGRAGLLAAIVAGLLFLIEVMGVPFYARNSTSDWVVQVLGLVLSLIGLIATAALVLQAVRSRRSVRLEQRGAPRLDTPTLPSARRRRSARAAGPCCRQRVRGRTLDIAPSLVRPWR